MQFNPVAAENMPIVSRNSSTGSPFSTCTSSKNCSASSGVSCGGACLAVNTVPNTHTPQTVARRVNIRDVDFMYGERRFRIGLPGHVIRADYVSVGQHYGTDASDGRPVLDRFERHRDLIAGPEQQPAPASLHQVGGVGGLDYPVDGVAAFVRYIEVDLDVDERTDDLPADERPDQSHDSRGEIREAGAARTACGALTRHSPSYGSRLAWELTVKTGGVRSRAVRVS